MMYEMIVYPGMMRNLSCAIRGMRHPNLTMIILQCGMMCISWIMHAIILPVAATYWQMANGCTYLMINGRILSLHVRLPGFCRYCIVVATC
jgi:hypothetical protein